MCKVFLSGITHLFLAMALHLIVLVSLPADPAWSQVESHEIQIGLKSYTCVPKNDRYRVGRLTKRGRFVPIFRGRMKKQRSIIRLSLSPAVVRRAKRKVRAMRARRRSLQLACLDVPAGSSSSLHSSSSSSAQGIEGEESSSSSSVAPSDPLNVADCRGQECFDNGRRIAAAYTYDISPPADWEELGVEAEEELDILMSHGVNAVIIKGGISNNIDYSSYPDRLPDTPRYYGGLARAKGLMFFQAFNYVHFLSSSTITDRPIVYATGEEGSIPSLIDPVYWDHLGDIVVALAELSVEYPDLYRVDGIFLDFEMYTYEFGSYITRPWGFDDETFSGYVSKRCLHGTEPPIGSDQRHLRYDWLVSFDCYDDYRDYLSGLLRQLTAVLRARVKAVNSNFLIAAYPSPVHAYLKDIYSGWSAPDQPALVWGTEPHMGGGAERVPADLNNHLLPSGYYDFTEVYGAPIYGFYLGGMIPRAYFSGDWGYHIYTVSTFTHGYWNWTTSMFTRSYDYLLGLGDGNTYRVLCHEQGLDYAFLRNCENATEYQTSVDAFYAGMDRATAELKGYLLDPDHETSLELSAPAPYILHDPDALTELPSDELCRLSSEPPVSALPDPGLRFRNQHNLVVFAEQQQEVQIDLSFSRVGSQQYPHMLSWVVVDSNNVELPGATGSVASGPQPVDTQISFVAPESGLYYIPINPYRSAFTISASNVPLMVYENDKVHTISTPGRLSFWVPTSTDQFNIHIEGQGSLEGARAKLFVQDVAEPVAVDVTSPINNQINFDIAVPVEHRGKIWSLGISRPDQPEEPGDPVSDQILEDVRISFGESLPPLFGLSEDERYFLTPECSGP